MAQGKGLYSRIYRKLAIAENMSKENKVVCGIRELEYLDEIQDAINKRKKQIGKKRLKVI